MAEKTPDGMKAQHKRPIKRIVLRKERKGKDSRHLEAKVEDNGELILSGQDLGPEVRRFFQTDEYEYFYRVPSSYKDTVLLRLLKEKFDEEDFLLDEWLQKHGILYEFENYF
jgi:hypothetical protein